MFIIDFFLAFSHNGVVFILIDMFLRINKKSAPLRRNNLIAGHHVCCFRICVSEKKILWMIIAHDKKMIKRLSNERKQKWSNAMHLSNQKLPRHFTQAIIWFVSGKWEEGNRKSEMLTHLVVNYMYDRGQLYTWLL